MLKIYLKHNAFTGKYTEDIGNVLNILRLTNKKEHYVYININSVINKLGDLKNFSKT